MVIYFSQQCLISRDRVGTVLQNSQFCFLGAMAVTKSCQALHCPSRGAPRSAFSPLGPGEQMCFLFHKKHLEIFGNSNRKEKSWHRCEVEPQSCPAFLFFIRVILSMNSVDLSTPLCTGGSNTDQWADGWRAWPVLQLPRGPQVDVTIKLLL